MSWIPLNMESFGHKIFISSQPIEANKQKTLLTQVAKEYTLMMEKPFRPLYIESIGHKMFILSQQFL